VVATVPLGCERPAPPADPAPEAATAAASAPGPPRPVPHPELAGLEPAVADVLRAGRQELEEILARPVSDAARADAYGRAGLLYHAHSLRDAAEACYRNAAALAPRTLRWPYLLGHICDDEGRPAEAVERFETALRLDAAHVPSLVHLGRVLLELNRLDEAEPRYRRAMEVDPECAAAFVGLGKIALARRDHAAAVDHLETARRLDPQATEMNYPLGLAYRGLGERDKALAFLEARGKRVAALPDPILAEVHDLAGGWRIHLNRGATLFQAGLHEAALAEYRRAVEAAPDEATAVTNLGSALAKLGRVDEAERAFRRSVALDPGATLAHYNLGVLAARRGADEEAIAHYGEALRIDAALVNARLNLANALRRVGRFADALEQYRHVIRQEPGHASARLGAGLTLVRLGQWTDAHRSLEAGVQALPDDAPLRHALARLLAAAPADEVRDGARALELALALANERPTLAHVETVAMAAAESGRFELAVTWQQRAVDAAERARRADLLTGLSARLDRYRAGEPCRTPWRPDDPAIAPRSHGAEGSTPASRP
jgi:tetratricopeptide (TPR) repeat protein